MAGTQSSVALGDACMTHYAAVHLVIISHKPISSEWGGGGDHKARDIGLFKETRLKAPK